MILPRRQFLTGFMGLVAAPAIVRIESLMPVRSPRLVMTDMLLEPYVTRFERMGEQSSEVMREIVEFLTQTNARRASVIYGSHVSTDCDVAQDQ